MDKKAKDFEKGWEEYKAKKQQEIKEMAQDIACGCVDLVESSCGDTPCYVCIARKLKDKNYRKIPENAVVLNQEEWAVLHNDYAKALYQKEVNTRKETAGKFAERVKNLEEALLDMVVQFCQMVYEGELRHTFMSAEEQAFDVLDIDYGEKVDDVYERFNKKWNRPIDEICKEITEDNV